MSGIEKTVTNEAITRLLAQRNYIEAIKLLQQQLNEQRDGETHALLALAYFQAEQYHDAVTEYTKALIYEPSNVEWRAMLALAEVNTLPENPTPMADSDYFESDDLLANPLMVSGALPPLLSAPDLVERVNRWLGDQLGDVIAFLMNNVTQQPGQLV